MAKKTKKDPVAPFAWGAILILVAVWMIISLESTAARIIGGGVVAILGISSIIEGIVQVKTKKKTKFGTLVWGAALLIVGIWMVTSLENLAARMVGGGIVIILGLAEVYKGIMKLVKKK